MEAVPAAQQLKATIMIVEDDPLQRMVMATALKMSGYTVVEANDGIEALQRLDESFPDLIISDIGMPNIDGLELLKALRANPETESIPFILATANNSADDISQGFQLGADDYLTKPISLVELQARVTAKIKRPSVPAKQLPRDRQTGLLNESVFIEAVNREVERAAVARETGCLVYVSLKERVSLNKRYAGRSDTPIIKQLLELAEHERLPLEIMGTNADNDLLILILDAAPANIHKRLDAFAQRILLYNFVVGEDSFRLTPLIGYIAVDGLTPADELLVHARSASAFARREPGLHPVEYTVAKAGLINQQGLRVQLSRALAPVRTLIRQWNTAIQIGVALGVGIVILLALLVLLEIITVVIAPTVFIVTLLALLLIAAITAWEDMQAQRRDNPPANAHPAPAQPPTAAEPEPVVKATVMVVEDDPLQLNVIATALKISGYNVVRAKDGVEALQRLDETFPDLIISDIAMPNIDGLELLKALRSNPETEGIPFILVTARNTVEEISQGFQVGADDYLTKPISLVELQARVTAKIKRPTVPASQLQTHRQTGLLNEIALLDEVRRELVRPADAREKSYLVCVSVSERELINERFGGRIDAPIMKQMIALAGYDELPLEIMGTSAESDLLILIPDATVESVKKRLNRFSQRMARHTFVVGEESVRLTPIVGYVPIENPTSAEELLERTRSAALFAGLHLDLQPVEFAPSMAALGHERKKRTQTMQKVRRWKLPSFNWRTGFQIALTLVLGVGAPFTLYAIADSLGHDITQGVYILVVIGLLGTSILIWVEGIMALRRVDPPEVPAESYPAASAIIAAYLPNEAATIEATIEAFLRVDYPGALQVILAYNTPRDLPIERVFKEIAARDPRFVPFRVKDSTSKAQNVNAALSQVIGKFVGVFDADHHPDPDSFRRAWRWLASGYDVVQGHCLVRNGDASWVARTVAVEFEAIYAVSHPGRARLHKFGIFGGSNGYWKTELLRETRMHGFMLTEDIDSSFRVISNGYKIANDPYLISRELATTTVKAVWNQRMRWAQGWYQVTLVQTPPLLRSPRLTLRQKLGVFHLLVWREIYPWLSWQVIPIIAFWSWKLGGVDKVNWFVPIFVITSAFTMSTGPLQLLFVRRLADESIRKRQSWMWWYLVVAAFVYVEYKNLIGRVAQIKETMGERVWKVTART